ncbi:hypothetical protein AB0D22_06685 [Kitasatospora sp. NPDC048538]|uniref:hypothetical protein n=1 Tax=Kitasatospora sp. NPDC048538 TaxID=3155633 RepID=UPI0033F3F6A7
MELSPGLRIEAFTREFAGVFGMPDFVYAPETVTQGRRRRELSDGLLVVGQRGLILQSKSRHPGQQPDTADKAERWCHSEGADGMRQGRGTRRTMQQLQVPFTSVRGHRRLLPDSSSWPTVVIIWHPDMPTVEFPAEPDTLFMSLPDWSMLHRMIRSTSGVISYVERALASGIKVPLGHEQHRYQALAAGDLIAAYAVPGSVPGLRPFFPDDRTLRNAVIFEELLELAARAADVIGVDAYLRVLEALDRTPVEARSSIGATMKGVFEDMIRSNSAHCLYATGTPQTRLHLLYAIDASPALPAQLQAGIANFGKLRHLQAIEAGADPDSETLVVTRIHRPGGTDSVFFNLVSGPVTLFPAARAALEEFYKPHREPVWQATPAAPY